MTDFFRFTYPPAITPLLLAALTNAALAIYAFRRRDMPHATVFAWTMVAITLWTFSNAAEFASVEFSAKLFWLKFKYLGSAGAPALWLVFSLGYTEQEKRPARPYLALMGLWVVVVWLLAWTNDAHGLFWQDIYLWEPALGLSVVHGDLFWVYCVFAYLMVLAASFCYVVTVIRSPALYRWQAAAMLFCGLLPLLGGAGRCPGTAAVPGPRSGHRGVLRHRPGSCLDALALPVAGRRPGRPQFCDREHARRRDRAGQAGPRPQRLARELHDGLGQVMGYVNVQAQAAREQFATGQTAVGDATLAHLAEVAQDAHADVREFILGMKTGDAPAQGFFPTLEKYLHQFTQNYGLPVTLSLPEGPRDDWFEPAVQVQLLRIIQEALTNARRHAGATAAQVLFLPGTDHVQVVIEDDGHGFDVESARSGIHQHHASSRDVSA